MNLTEILEESNIFLDFRAETREEVLKKLASGLMPEKGEAVYDLLNEREQIMSTAVAPGFAIPHCHTELADHFYVGLAVSKEGVEFNSLNKQKINVLVIIIAPKKEINKYLSLLSHTSRIFSHHQIIDDILGATGKAEILEILKRYEELR